MIMKKLIIFLFIILLPSFLIGQIQLNRFILSFPVPTAQDLDKGYIESNSGSSALDISISVNKQSNTKYILFIKTEQPYFYPINLNKSHYDLLWKLSSASESRYRPVRLQKIKVAAGIASSNVDVDFRLELDWNDPPANYRLEVVFILEVITTQIDIKDKKYEKYIPIKKPFRFDK